MKIKDKVFILFIILFGGFYMNAQDITFFKEDIKIKVMTYNIRGGKSYPDNVQNLENIIKTIEKDSPDILMLQEVGYRERINWFEYKEQKGQEQTKIIAEKFGMDYYFYLTENTDYFGNAILSKYPIKEKFGYDLPLPTNLTSEEQKKAWQRGAVGLIIDVNGVEIMVISTHLGLLGIKEVRLELNEIYKRSINSNMPVLIAGDFNLEYEEIKSNLSAMFYDFGSVNHEINKQLKTIPSTNPNRQIDYILATKKDFNIYDCKTISSQASDHIPIISILGVKKN